MEFSGVYHKTSEQMSYALDEDRLIVNIKTGYDVKQVFIHYGDPYEAGILGGKEKWIGKREEMIYKKRLPYQIWWTTTLLPEYKRCKYYFELRTEKEVWYYFEDGCNGVQREHNKKLNNGLPILHKVPPKRDYGRYFCIMAEKGGTSHGGLTEKLSPFFHAKKQEVNAYGR